MKPTKTKCKMTALTLSVCLVAVPFCTGIAFAEQPVQASGTLSMEASKDAANMSKRIPADQAGSLVRVSTIEELKTAMSQAQPGDIIEMADGTWTDANIAFSATATADKPVTLRAQTQGKVILSGNSKLSVNSPYLIVDGLSFKQSTPTNTGTVISLNSDYGELTNTVIDNYNPPDTNNRYSWVYIKGKYNKVDHNLFTGKNHSGPLLAQHRDSKHNTVSYNYFKDIPFHNENGREIIQVIGYGDNEELGSDGAFMTIEHNLFEHADGEGAEIISLKSNHNVVQYNTFRGSRGGIVGRSGNNNTVQGNFILGEHMEGTAGIRLSGQNHTVINNYVADVAGVGLTLTSGEYYVDDNGKTAYLTQEYQPIFRANTPYGVVPTYGQVKNGLYAFNTFVNNGGADLFIGNWYKNNWPKKQLVLLPENNRIEHNISYKNPDKGASVVTSVYAPPQDTAPPLDHFQFSPNRYKANIVIGGEVNLNSDQAAGGFIQLNPKPQWSSEEGIYRFDPENSLSRSIPSNDSDAKSNKPLTASDVGPRSGR